MIRIALACMLLAGCTSDRFFVRRNGADLPVWARGRAESPLTVVVQHGSGTSGALYDWMPAFNELEGSVRVVYWDQRGAGLSQGAPPPDSLVLEESVQDLDLVLDAVRDRYPGGRIALLGHSLGGGISLSYLSRGDVDSDIVGYVDVSGGRSLGEAYTTASAEIVSWAQGKTADPEDRYADIIAFYEARPTFPRQEPDRSQHAATVDEVLAERGYDQGASTAAMTSFLLNQGVSDAWFGPFDPLGFLANTQRVVQDYDLDGVDLSPEDVSTIEVPTLVLAGRFDFAVPLQVSQRTFDAITPNTDGSLFVELEESGHFPMWDEPRAFTVFVRDFLGTL